MYTVKVTGSTATAQRRDCACPNGESWSTASEQDEGKADREWTAYTVVAEGGRPRHYGRIGGGDKPVRERPRDRCTATARESEGTRRQRSRAGGVSRDLHAVTSGRRTTQQHRNLYL